MSNVIESVNRARRRRDQAGIEYLEAGISLISEFLEITPATVANIVEAVDNFDPLQMFDILVSNLRFYP